MILSIFSVIGTTYGGDGVSTFNVPDLRGRAVMSADSSNPFGQVQPDQNKRHAHAVYVKDTGHQHNYTGVYSSVNDPAGTIFSAYVNPSSVLTEVGHANIVVNDDDSNTPKNTTASSGGDEARPKNVRMNWIIKY